MHNRFVPILNPTLACHSQTFITHSHIQLNTAAIKIVGLFAEGLRGGFTTYAKPITVLVIAKCKVRSVVYAV